MLLTVKIATRRDFKNSDLWDMHALRAKVFHGRMGWDVTLKSGLEIDGYDTINPYYMLIREPGGILRGCWRLLPTEGPYMLKDTFPQLLHGHPAPAEPTVWELSRFIIESRGQQMFGFSSIALQFIGEIIAYGHRAGIKHYVTVTTTAIERMLRRAGVIIHRFGPPVVIGVENAVALLIDIDKSHQKLKRGYCS